jgi:hypothetical protein
MSPLQDAQLILHEERCPSPDPSFLNLQVPSKGVPYRFPHMNLTETAYDNTDCTAIAHDKV